MAETPSIQSPARTQTQPGPGLESTQYWCYHCDKRVAVETLPDLPDLVCHDCKKGFIESISAEDALTPASDPMNDSAIGNEFIQVLRLIADAAREEDAPSPLPSDPSDDDYLRIELDGWDNENEGEDDDDEDDDNEEEEEERSVEVNEEDALYLDHYTENQNRSNVEEDEDGVEVIDPLGEDEEAAAEEVQRRRRNIIRLQLRDFASRAANRRNRILDWAEILMGLEDHSIELRLQLPESDTYVGNPGDYVDAAEYEALLQNLAESDSGARRGAPPAAKLVVEGLESVVIEKEKNIIECAICKDMMNVGEIAKNLPCGHGYHGECIFAWLGSRNTCPVCRFELPTDDLEYEEDRKKRVVVAGLRAASSGGSSSSGGGGGGQDSVLG
ncbi:hypothetical protein CASFOL_021398 [Castilleja foliolosa]|uniref:RING-type E3 ubiquitin transferase n=1 Tax=Castilleja foliolosa TaxID=1961234 RepID=A0ABD3CZ12_9LAMI